MALVSEKVAIAIALQASAGVFTAPSLPNDLMPVLNLSPQNTAVTVANNEATGSAIKNADDVAGVNRQISFDIYLRAPAGTAVPAANTFNPGKILQAAKMTEVVNAAPLVASEAIGGSADQRTVQLGANAGAVADVYKAFPVLLEGQSAYKEQLNAIRSYAADKTAVLAAEAEAAIAGNYNIPAFLGYHRSVTSDEPPLLSFTYWLDGHRHDCKNGRVTQLQLLFPTTSKTQGQQPTMRVTLSYDVENIDQVEATPAVPSLGSVPLFRDGRSALDYYNYCTSTVTADFGITSEAPDCPISESGSEAEQLIRSVGGVSMSGHHALPNVFNPDLLARLQQQHPYMLQYGSGPGNYIQFVVPDSRLNFPNPNTSGTFILDDGALLIDAFDRGMALNFVF